MAGLFLFSPLSFAWKIDAHIWQIFIWNCQELRRPEFLRKLSALYSAGKSHPAINSLCSRYPDIKYIRLEPDDPPWLKVKYFGRYRLFIIRTRLDRSSRRSVGAEMWVVGHVIWKMFPRFASVCVKICLEDSKKNLAYFFIKIIISFYGVLGTNLKFLYVLRMSYMVAFMYDFFNSK